METIESEMRAAIAHALTDGWLLAYSRPDTDKIHVHRCGWVPFVGSCSEALIDIDDGSAVLYCANQQFKYDINDPEFLERIKNDLLLELPSYERLVMAMDLCVLIGVLHAVGSTWVALGPLAGSIAATIGLPAFILMAWAAKVARLS